MRNPFESLIRPGVIGAVSRSFKTITVYSLGNDVLQIYYDELAPGKWAFGYLFNFNGERISVLPGEGSGYFESDRNAILYALGHIKAKRRNLPEDVVFAIDKTIDFHWNEPLFRW